MSLETLLGISDQPAHLAGHGPITAHVARDIAFEAGGVGRRLVTDPRGEIVDYGGTRYEPPVALKEFVQARDRFCRTPWCDRPAGTCDLDHLVPYPQGSTAAGNVQCKCRHHHRMEHEGRISPTGTEYYSAPVRVRLPPRLRPSVRAAAKESGPPPF